MFKNVTKIVAATMAALFLAGCFSSSSLNYRVPAKAAMAKTSASAKEYTLDADFLFDFDQATLTARGKSSLNRVAKEIKATGAKQVTVTGYTDRLGTPAYNQKLSEARAQAAKTYLAGKGVKAKINAVGRGEANQVKACKNETGDKLKSCLKPNRRVHIRAE